MWKVTSKGLLAHKLRLALTALAIVLGVTFISGTFVLTDTLHNTFNTLFGHVYQNIDFEVRAKAAFTDNSGDTAAARPSPSRCWPRCGRSPEWRRPTGRSPATPSSWRPTARPSPPGAPPTWGSPSTPTSRSPPCNSAEGHAPTTPHDVVMDAGTAQKYHFEVGQHVRVLLLGPPETFTLTGIVRFGTADNLAGATLAAFSLPTAQQLFGLTGQFDAIDVVAAPGADKSTVQHDIARVLPPGVEVVTGQTVAAEQTNDINQALSFFSTALLVFAFISLFVGGFTIFNTFSIIVGQRTRELALLRIVGASRRQLFRSVLLEAAIVGVRGVTGRPRARGAGRGGARRAPQGVRHHPAHRLVGLRDPDRDRGPGRGRGSDGGLGRQPGPSGHPHPAGGRPGRPPVRRTRSRPGDVSPSAP